MVGDVLRDHHFAALGRQADEAAAGPDREQLVPARSGVADADGGAAGEDGRLRRARPRGPSRWTQSWSAPRADDRADTISGIEAEGSSSASWSTRLRSRWIWRRAVGVGIDARP